MKDLCAIWCTDNWDQDGRNKDVVKPLTADLNSCLQEASAKKEDVSCSQIQA